MLQPRLTIDFGSQKSETCLRSKICSKSLFLSLKMFNVGGLTRMNLEPQNGDSEAKYAQNHCFRNGKLSIFEGLRESGFGVTKWRNMAQS